MKSLQTLLTESVSNSTHVLEYLSYRISNWDELINGLIEIGAPVKIEKTSGDKSLKIDGVVYRVPKNIKTGIGVDMMFDEKILDALRDNSALVKMWKTAKQKFKTILNNLRRLDTVVGYLRDPERLDWGNTGANSILEYYSQISKIKSIMDDILTKSNIEELRRYEVLRHLFDRGYYSMMTGQN